MVPAVWFLSDVLNSYNWSWIVILIVTTWTIGANFMLYRSASEYTVQFSLVNFLLLALLAVGFTGWFGSPFIFLLYLIAIGIISRVHPLVGFGYLVSLGAVYYLSLERIVAVRDWQVWISLLITFPLGLYYQKIDALQHDGMKKGSVLDRVLSNKFVKFATDLRQSLVNIKSYTHVVGNNKLESSTSWQYMNRIYDSAALALKDLASFEEEVTGEKLKVPTKKPIDEK